MEPCEIACDFDISRAQIGMSPPLILLSGDTLSSVTSLLAQDPLPSAESNISGQSTLTNDCASNDKSQSACVMLAAVPEPGPALATDAADDGTMVRPSGADEGSNAPVLREASFAKEHIKDVFKKRALSGARCAPCGITFDSWSVRDGHMSQWHLSVECSVCGQQSTGLEAYKQHMQTHSQSSGYRCHSCQRNFLHPYALLSHLEKNHWDSTRGCCQLCGFTSRTKGRHFHQHLPETNKLVYVGDENQVQLTNIYKNSNLLSVNLSQGNTELNLQAVSTNTSKVHSNPETNFAGVTLISVDSKKSSLGYQELPDILCGSQLRGSDCVMDACYRCESCSERFVREDLLSNHRLYLHMAFQCRWCEDQVQGFAAYQLHVSTHAQTADVCQDPKVLRTHALKPVPCSPSHRKPGTFPCTTCGRVCATLKAYSTHMAQHLADSPHQCPVCQQRFLHQVALTAHCRRKHRTTLLKKKSTVAL